MTKTAAGGVEGSRGSYASSWLIRLWSVARDMFNVNDAAMDERRGRLRRARRECGADRGQRVRDAASRPVSSQPDISRPTA
jgi:hypothetical protein